MAMALVAGVNVRLCFSPSVGDLARRVRSPSSISYPRKCCGIAVPLWSLPSSPRPLSIINAVHHQHTSHSVHLPVHSNRRFAAPDTRRVLPIRALLALSVAAALAFLQRKQQRVQLVRSRNLMAGKDDDYVASAMMAKREESAATKTRRIDSHLHVWASPKEANEFPYFPGQEPTLPGNVDYLLESMEEAEVDGALIIQPINHKFDHSYVSSVIRTYPGKYVGCCLADPSEGGGGVREMERLIAEEGYRAVRFNPYLWPAGENMTNKVGKAMFSRAGELGAVVGFMCFKGLMLHIDDIEELCLEFPATAVMIDHFGFCKPAQSKDEEEAWRRLLSLARFPQVYVKTSAFFRVSRQSFPYEDTWPLVQQLVDAFGAKRVLWGSDFPFVAAECGYTKACQELPSIMASKLRLSSEDWEWVLGRTALQLFAGAWQESNLVS